MTFLLFIKVLIIKESNNVMSQRNGFRVFPKVFCLFLTLSSIVQRTYGQQNTIWKIGEADNTPSGMALAPNQFSRFVEDDFGYEDRFFLIGHSNQKTAWPYVLPG